MSRVIFHDSLAETPRLNQGGALQDKFGRSLCDLRISVTDQCNFRCSYCMPREIFGTDYAFLPSNELLSFDEISRIAQIAINNGVQKLRLTGGEPLMRKNLQDLIASLSKLRNPAGESVDISLTTNGAILKAKAKQLYDAGLHRITVSLDALEQDLFAHMSDSKISVQAVLDGIKTAAGVGMSPVKINMVVRKGTNDHQIMPMVEYFRNTGHILRFIEFMDVGSTNGWSMQEVLTGAEIIEIINSKYPLKPKDANYSGEVAKRWVFKDGAGEIGLITSVSQPFCASCTRLRLSPEGKLFTCLFAEHGFDLKELLRTGATDKEIGHRLAGVWQNRTDRYSEQRGKLNRNKKIEMSYIGG